MSSEPICTTLSVWGGPPIPRTWSRAQYQCPQSNGDPDYYNKLDERRKAEIFKYKNNANQMSRKQQYANFARGRNYTRKQTWATQSATYTNPNIQNLPRSGNTLICNTGIKSWCAMSYQNDTPGPPTQICLDPTMPLYNYRPQRYFGTGDNYTIPVQEQKQAYIKIKNNLYLPLIYPSTIYSKVK